MERGGAPRFPRRTGPLARPRLGIRECCGGGDKTHQFALEPPFDAQKPKSDLTCHPGTERRDNTFHAGVKLDRLRIPGERELQPYLMLRGGSLVKVT